MKKTLLNKVKNSGLEFIPTSKNVVRILLPIEGANYDSRLHIEINNNKSVSVAYNHGMRIDVFFGRNAYIVLKRFIKAGKMIKNEKPDQ